MVLYKHSFRARKVVQMMDFERKERREKSAALIRVGHPKQKKEGKIARLKNYIKSSYRSLLFGKDAGVLHWAMLLFYAGIMRLHAILVILTELVILIVQNFRRGRTGRVKRG